MSSSSATRFATADAVATRTPTWTVLSRVILGDIFCGAAESFVTIAKVGRRRDCQFA